MRRRFINFSLVLAGLLALNGCWLDKPEDSVADIQRHLGEGKYRSAEITAKSLLQQAQQDGDAELQRVSRLLLARTYFQTGDNPNAARFYDALTQPVSADAPAAFKAITSTVDDWHRWLLSAWEAQDNKLAASILKMPEAFFSAKAKEIYGIRQLVAEQRSADARSVLELTEAPDDATSPYVRYQYALLQSSLDSEQALALATSLTQEDPQFAQAVLLQARLLQASGDHESALQAYLKFAALRPNDLQGRSQAALLAFQTGDYDQGREVVEALVKMAPKNAMVLQLRGMLMMYDKNFAEAKAYAQESLGMGLDTFINHLVIGVGAYQEKSWEQANQHLSEISQQLPGDHFARKMLVETKLQLDESREAAAVFKDLDPGGMIDVALANRLSAKLIQDGGFSAASAIQSKVADIDVDEQNLMLQRQLLGQALKRNEFKQALIESVQNQDAETKDKLRLVLLYIADNEMEKAVQLVDAWLKQTPRDVNALNAAALVEQRLGNLKKVRQYLDRSLAIDADNIPSLVLQLNLLRQEQQWEKVAAGAEKLMLQRDFINPLVFMQWLEASQQLGNPVWDQALQLIGAPRDEQLEGTWLTFLLQNSQFDEAERYLQEQVAAKDWTMRHAASSILVAAGQNKSDLAATRIEKLIQADYFDQIRVVEFAIANAARVQRFDLVLEALERAHKLDLAIANRSLIAASAHIRLNDLARARQSLAQHAVKDGAYFEVSADLAVARENYPEAWKQLEKSVADGITPVRLRRLFDVGNKISKGSAVRDYVREYFKARPNDNNTRRMISQWYIQDNPRFAIELLDSGSMQKELETDWVTTNNLAWLYHQVGNSAKARHYAEHAISRAPNRAEVIDTYETIFGRKPGA